MIHSKHYELGLALEDEEAFPTTPDTALSAMHASIVRSHRRPGAQLSPQMEQLGRFRNWMAVSRIMLNRINAILQREYTEKFVDVYGDRFPRNIREMPERALDDEKLDSYFVSPNRFRDFGSTKKTLYLVEAGYVEIDEKGRELLKDFARIREYYDELYRKSLVARTLDDLWKAFISEGDQVIDVLRQVTAFLHDLDHFMIAHPLLTEEYARWRLEREDHASVQAAPIQEELSENYRRYRDRIDWANYWIGTMEKARTRLEQALPGAVGLDEK